MAPVARRLAADPMAEEPDFRTDAAGCGHSKIAAEATAANTIVPLFAAPEVAGGLAGPDPAAAIDGPAAIAQIREVGARLRRMHDVAQAMIRRSLDQAEEAERRAHAAEAAAAAATLRADRAEERLRQAEARARLAEDRADLAEAAEADAQIWLRRTYACLKAETAKVEAKTR